jgi:hypothetical protein
LFEGDIDVRSEDPTAYEIYSEHEGQRRIHCQGQATLSPKTKRDRLDIRQLEREIGNDTWDSVRLYETCAAMGLHYGAAHRSITSISLAENQLMARLRLPEVVGAPGKYLLHPSLMDGALQASIGLVIDLNHPPSGPSVPFVLDSLALLSPCTQEMLAWVRYSRGSGAQDRVVKVDIDLCDEGGNVCVRMRGFASRSLKSSGRPGQRNRPVNPSEVGDVPDNVLFNDAFYRNILEKVLKKEISVDAAVDCE